MANDFQKASAPDNGPLRKPMAAAVNTPANRVPNRPTRNGRYYKRSGPAISPRASHARVTRGTGR
jgi:hypothetical protein